MVKPFVLLSVGLSLLLFASACSGNHDTIPQAQQQLPNGDIQEKTASTDRLPAFLDNQREEVRQIYRLAAQNVDVMKWIPCYCGCGQSAGHQSNQNCFIKEIQKDGSVVWDDHGTRCDTCMEIAVKTAQLKEQGKSTKEIRTMIDEQYQKGYAAPTKTPMPL